MTKGVLQRGLLALAVGAILVPRQVWAKKVAIEWRPLQGASAYEIQVERDGNAVVRKRLEDSAWSGELEPGVYVYRIRGFDRIRRPGHWTDPLPLVVQAGKPELEGPDDGKKVVLYDPRAGTQLRWKPIAGVTFYRIEVKRGSVSVADQVVSDPKLDLKSLPPGDYTWRVSAIIKPGGRMPASLRSKQWQGKPSQMSEFRIERAQLERPDPAYPIGNVVPPSDGKVRFKWSSVDGAEAYELEVMPKILDRKRTPAAQAPRRLTRVLVADNQASVSLPSEGDYVWKVRAVANLEAGKTPQAAGPQSVAAFRIDKNADYFEGAGYVALSTMLAPYSYQVVSPGTNASGTASSSALTMRASGEYWFRPHWGLGAAFEGTSFRIAGESYLRKGYELVAKYRLSFGGGKNNWAFSPKLGIEGRDYFEILPPSADLGTFGLTVYGLQLGADLRKAFSDRLSVGIKLAYFRPLFLSSSQAETLIGGASDRNISGGAQVLYWINRNWGLGAGGFVEMRSISYTLKSAPTGNNSGESVYMDGAYFFGSVIYSFGR